MKATPFSYPITPLIYARWSPVVFDSREIEVKHLCSIFEAARWAASSFNEQPWSFLIVQRSDKENFDKLLDCLVPQNQEWAQHAPVLFCTVAAKSFERNGKANKHAFYDTGMAVQNLILQAIAYDLYVHQMAGYDSAKLRVHFSIPETHNSIAVGAIGYLGNVEEAEENLRKRDNAPRSRKNVESFVFEGAWGQKASFFS